jgi:chemotaxis methyl-accepting protein methylase
MGACVWRRATPGELVPTVDLFLESLATALAERAVAIVLSGVGADGARGVVAISEAGGLVLAQSPESARFDGMPRAAVKTGRCHHVVSTSEMPARLLAHAQSPRPPRRQDAARAAEGQHSGGASSPRSSPTLRRRFSLDFSKYKPATVDRRISRRLEVHQLQRIEDYVQRLESDPHELDLLFSDLLIGVTEFFRDAEAFACLERQVLPTLFEAASAGELRVWVAACATGEEAYSLAILLHEHATAVGYRGRISVFATDAHRRSLEVASAGLYEEAQLRGVSAERRARYFTPEGPGGFKVRAELRRMIVFAPQNLLNDPPFTKMDLVSCRNLLIYFQPEAQARAIATLNFALRLNGALFLASSEGLGVFADDFATVSAPHKLFRKTRDVRLPPPALDPQPRAAGGPLVRRPDTRPTMAIDRHLLHDYDLLLSRWVPAGVLLDERFHALHHFGEVAPYLHPPSGRTGNTFVHDVAPDLQLAVSVALQRAASTQARFTVPNVELTQGDETHHIDVAGRGLAEREGRAEPLPGHVHSGGTGGVIGGRRRRGPGDARASGSLPGAAGAHRRHRDPAPVDPRESPGHGRGAADQQRGAPGHQRGVAGGQRRAAEHQRGTPVAQRQVRDEECRAAGPESGPQPAAGEPGDGHRLRRRDPGHPSVQSGERRLVQAAPAGYRPPHRTHRLSVGRPGQPDVEPRGGPRDGRPRPGGAEEPGRPVGPAAARALSGREALGAGCLAHQHGM